MEREEKQRKMVAFSEQRREVTWRLTGTGDSSGFRVNDDLTTSSTFSINFTQMYLQKHRLLQSLQNLLEIYFKSSVQKVGLL